MDSASNSMTPRQQTVRSSSEYHSQAGSLYHPGNGTLMRRLSSNPTELSSSQPLRRVEGTVTVKRIWILHFFLPCVFVFKQYRTRGSAAVLNAGRKITTSVSPVMECFLSNQNAWLKLTVCRLLCQRPAPPQVQSLFLSGTACSCPVRTPPPGPLKR